MMSPLQVKLLLHFYSCPEKHPCSDLDVYQEAIKGFLQHDIIKPHRGSFTTTARGDKFVEMILDTPMSVQRYIDPRDVSND